MRTVTLHGYRLELYDSIDELPIINFQKYNKYLLIDAGIGGDADAIDDHIIKVAKLISRGDSKEAIQELQNMRQSLFMINSQISPQHMAFAALVKSVDGKPVTDLTDDGLKKLLNKLNKAKRSELIDKLVRIKKKITDELDIYFPAIFDSAKAKNAYSRLYQRTVLVLEGIIKNQDNGDKIKEIDDESFSVYKPFVYDGPESVEIKYEKQFEDSCLLISEKLGVDPKGMTVFQFYNAVELIKRRADEERKIANKYKRK